MLFFLIQLIYLCGYHQITEWSETRANSLSSRSSPSTRAGIEKTTAICKGVPFQKVGFDQALPAGLHFQRHPGKSVSRQVDEIHFPV